MRLAAQLHLTRQRVRLLITNRDDGDILKARLPVSPAHPRALLTLLEGVALWSGAKLCTAIVAEPDYQSWVGSGVLGDELWPAESQLVQFDVVARGNPTRLRGLGDFRELRTLRGGF